MLALIEKYPRVVPPTLAILAVSFVATIVFGYIYP